jgi:hypothetical protein
VYGAFFYTCLEIDIRGSNGMRLSASLGHKFTCLPEALSHVGMTTWNTYAWSCCNSSFWGASLFVSQESLVQSREMMVYDYYESPWYRKKSTLWMALNNCWFVMYNVLHKCVRIHFDNVVILLQLFWPLLLLRWKKKSEKRQESVPAAKVW